MANEGETGEALAVNDQELFETATAQTEPEAPQTEAETPEPKADAGGRLHGDNGKFVSKEAKEPAKPAEPAQQQEQHIDHRVPLTELLNEREKRQKFEQEIAAERQRREALERRVNELTAKPAEPEKLPDIFENPQGYTQSLEQRFEQRLRMQEQNFSFRLAHRQHGQDFETAYQSLIREGEMGNRQAVQAVMQSPDPGEALMRWHKQTTLFEKTGGDLDKYLQTQREQLLADPEFLKQAAEKIRAGANGQQPKSVVQLPPSLNRIASAAPATAGGDDDMSDAGLFRHALSR